jgi:hypothetical protein
MVFSQLCIASLIPSSNGRGFTPNSDNISCVEKSALSPKRRKMSELGVLSPIRFRISSNKMAGGIGMVTNNRLRPFASAHAAARSTLAQQPRKRSAHPIFLNSSENTFNQVVNIDGADDLLPAARNRHDWKTLQNRNQSLNIPFLETTVNHGRMQHYAAFVARQKRVLRGSYLVGCYIGHHGESPCRTHHDQLGSGTAESRQGTCVSGMSARDYLVSISHRLIDSL